MVASAESSRGLARDDAPKAGFSGGRSRLARRLTHFVFSFWLWTHRCLRSLPPSLVLAVGILISGAATYVFARDALQDAERRFERSARFMENWVRHRGRAYETTLAQTGAFLTVSGASRADFHSYVHDMGLLNAFPGVRDVGYLDRVDAAKSSAWLAEARTFSAGATLRPSPSTSRPVVFPVTYFESVASLDALLLGMDHSSDPVRAAALELARDEGRVHLSGRTQSFATDAAPSESVVIMYAPVYERGEPRGTVQERRDALSGHAYMLFRANDLFERLNNEAQSRTNATGEDESEYEVFDGEGTSEDALLFRNPNDSLFASARFRRTVTIETAGHPWTLRFHSKKSLDREIMSALGISAPLVFGSGLGLSLLFFLVLRSSRLEALRERALHDSESRALRAVRESENRFRVLANTTPVLMWMSGEDGACTFFNESWLKFTGRQMADEIGNGWQDALHPEDRGFALETYEAAFAAREPFSIESRFRRSDGSYRWILGHAVPRYESDGTFAGYLGTCVDIEERKRAEQERERMRGREHEALAEAERQGQLKDEFLATLSHELRTPLSAITGWAEMLMKNVLPKSDYPRAFAAIDRNARAQLKLVSDLLDISRIISGKLELETAVVEISSVVRAGVESVRFSAESKGVELIVREPDRDARCERAGKGDRARGTETNLRVFGDAARLQQVLWNLLSNAIKFTPQGGRVMVTSAEEEGHVVVRVTDTGEGIESAFLPHLFERFTQSDTSTTRRHGGLGLGLSIVRHFIELHGGRVWAESEGRDLGATVGFRLPLHQPRDPKNVESAFGSVGTGGSTGGSIGGGSTRGGEPWSSSGAIGAAGSAGGTGSGASAFSEGEGDGETPTFQLHTNQGWGKTSRALEGLNVVVVDDNEDAVNMLATILRHHGALVVETHSASHAFDCVRRQRPSLVISDLGMPEEDGFSLMRRIRALPPEQGGRVPALALSAHVQEKSREEALAAGYFTCLTKPVDAVFLIETISLLAGVDRG